MTDRYMVGIRVLAVPTYRHKNRYGMPNRTDYSALCKMAVIEIGTDVQAMFKWRTYEPRCYRVNPYVVFSPLAC
ncbi:hypothetical protein Tsubulata_019138 [Turnera subulata]|uniref:Uncharacterized protein n=1 Tax=Turnera subulata TaxID=218843 RepID=A0A9Q0G616_9ROSI|nr:hypothetical protein Tsubulata_019138 [Turnera subulata]